MIFSGSGHPIFRASSAFERGELRSKGGRKYTYFNGSEENIELLLRTIISANQLSVYGANSRFVQRSTQGYYGSWETCSTWSFEIDGDSYSAFCRRNSDQCTATEKPSARIRAEIRAVVRRPEIIQSMFWCGFEACRKRTMLLDSWYRRRTTDATFMPRMHDTSKWKRRFVSEDGFSRIQESVQSWTQKFVDHNDRYSIEVQIPSLFEDNTVSWVRIVNGVDTCVTASMLTKKEEDRASEKPIAKARPGQKPTVTLTSVSIPVLERNG